jgi:hypothetical protein
MTFPTFVRRPFHAGATLAAAALMAAGLLLPASPAAAQQADAWWDASDPRIGLGAGWMDAEEASWNMELVDHSPTHGLL